MFFPMPFFVTVRLQSMNMLTVRRRYTKIKKHWCTKKDLVSIKNTSFFIVIREFD